MNAMMGTMIQHLKMENIKYELTKNITNGNLIAEVMDQKGNLSTILTSEIEENYSVLDEKYVFSSKSQNEVYNMWQQKCKEIKYEYNSCKTKEQRVAVIGRWFAEGTSRLCVSLNQLIEQNKKIDQLISKFKL